MKLPRIVIAVIGLLACAGCASSPKVAKTTTTPKLTYWEYRELSGFGAERSPEAEKLKQQGWTYLGTRAGGGNMAEDYGLVSVKNGSGVAVFRRPYK
jgi:hypothetical protein